jgi:hypothetical protein
MRTLALLFVPCLALADSSVKLPGVDEVARAASCHDSFEVARRELIGRVPRMEIVHVRRDFPSSNAWREGIGLSGVGLFYDADFTRSTVTKSPGAWNDQHGPQTLRSDRTYRNGFAWISAFPPDAPWGPIFVTLFKAAADRCAAIDR